MELGLLNDFVVIFGVGLVVVYLCHRLRVPSVVGLLLTGVLAGPHGLGVVHNVHEVEVLAEIGVVLLLFTIGIEFSLAHLLRIRTIALVGGGLQIVLTVAAGAGVVWWAGLGGGESVFVGFLLALSSTAVVLGMIQQRAEVASPHGRIEVGILIFQDIAVVPMMIMIPLLAGAAANPGDALLQLVLKGAALLGVVFVLARWIVPRALYQVAQTQDRELFLLAVTFIGVGVAWLTASVELSLALGAFLAGLIISESEYSQRALGNILPFRDVFTSLFFVSIGMLLDVGVLLANPVLIVALTAGVVVLKALCGGLATFALGFPLRTAVLVGLGLGQIGEFSFVLSKTGVDNGFLSGDLYQVFLAVSVLTIIATPFLTMAAPALAQRAARLPLRRLKIGPTSQDEALREKTWADHVVVVGYGVAGKQVVRAAARANIPYLIIEMNPQTIREARNHGEPIYYGDATQEAVLQHAGVQAARVAVVVISDPTATRRVIAAARALNPSLHVVARTQFINEIPDLIALGASEVIPDEFEASIRVFSRVLKKYLVSRQDIEKFAAEVRANGYHFLREGEDGPFGTLPEWAQHLSELEVSTLQIKPASPLVGQSLAQAALRNRYEVTVLAIRRGEETLANPKANDVLQVDDGLILMGPVERMAEVAQLCDEAA